MRIHKLLLVVALALVGGCEGDTINNPNPAGPDGVTIVSVSTNCKPTLTAGEIKITDASGPSGVVDRVSGKLNSSTGAEVCSWAISRQGNLEASATCAGLAAGGYTFTGSIILSTGQDPTPTTGSCALSIGAGE